MGFLDGSSGRESTCQCRRPRFDRWVGRFPRDPINIIHNYVETALNQIAPMVAKSYMDYRNYKQDFARMMDGINQKANTIMFRGDKENSNADSALVSTKRCLIFNQFNKELYKKFFLTEDEIKAINEGYIYVTICQQDVIQ